MGVGDRCRPGGQYSLLACSQARRNPCAGDKAVGAENATGADPDRRFAHGGVAPGPVFPAGRRSVCAMGIRAIPGPRGFGRPDRPGLDSLPGRAGSGSAHPRTGRDPPCGDQHPRSRPQRSGAMGLSRVCIRCIPRPGSGAAGRAVSPGSPSRPRFMGSAIYDPLDEIERRDRSGSPRTTDHQASRNRPDPKSRADGGFDDPGRRHHSGKIQFCGDRTIGDCRLG